jgi:hypothetical protein
LHVFNGVSRIIKMPNNPDPPVPMTRVIGAHGFNSTAGEESEPPYSFGVVIDFPIAPVSEEHDLEETVPITTRIVGP